MLTNFIGLLCQLQVGKHAVLSILLATFAGFGVVMSGSSIVLEFSRWRRRWQQRGSSAMTQ